MRFFKSLRKVDCLSHHFVCLKKSWEAVKCSARHQLLSPSWIDTNLMEFLFPSSEPSQMLSSSPSWSTKDVLSSQVPSLSFPVG